MKVYHPMGSTTTLMVAPAALMDAASAPSEWKDKDGKPVRFDIVFTDGMAEVPGNLGNWLIENGYVHKSRLIRAARQLLPH